MSQQSQTIALTLQAVMDLNRRTGALQATVQSHERRLLAMEKKTTKDEASPWHSKLPISEIVLLAFLMLSGISMHLMPPEWREDLRAIITARANK